jgi:dTMP kinase
VRIDGAHLRPLAGELVHAVPVEQSRAAVHGLMLPDLAPTADGTATATAQQLRTQAIQLADHLAVRHDDLTRREADLNARSAELESGLRNARAWFHEREAHLEQLRQRWLDERRKAQAELEAARQRLDQERRCDWADLQQKRVALERRAEEVDRAWAALHQVHEEVARTHRETLELRLANEEFRAELGLLVPAEVKERTLEQIRARLAEEYRQVSEGLSRQKRELLAIRRDLAEEHRKLTRERERLHRLASHLAGRDKGSDRTV